jgi:homogentisate 1,2-dioxygenase
VKRSFPASRREGTASRQAHADLPAGTFERELGRDGFYGAATHMHHRHPPTGWTSWEGPLRPRAFDLTRLGARRRSPWDAPEVLASAALRIRWWNTDGAMESLIRNGDGDDLLFVHEGGGELFCDYGHLTLREGDYLVLPRGTMWRLEPAGDATLLLVEATGDSYGLPDRGLIGRHALFDPAVLDVPALDDAFRAQQRDEVWRVVIRRQGALSTVTFPFNPLDAVGWHGDHAPVRLNWRDIRPIVSARMHLPPSIHTTFVSERFVVCTFVPRPLERDPGALKLPFFHNNDDYDEVLFYHRGTFVSRDHVHPGMVTFHPAGFTHGPHPSALAAAERGTRAETDEVAVMIDARDALRPAVLPDGVEWAGYVDSWRAGGGAGAPPGPAPR